MEDLDPDHDIQALWMFDILRFFGMQFCYIAKNKFLVNFVSNIKDHPHSSFIFAIRHWYHRQHWCLKMIHLYFVQTKRRTCIIYYHIDELRKPEPEFDSERFWEVVHRPVESVKWASVEGLVDKKTWWANLNLNSSGKTCLAYFDLNLNGKPNQPVVVVKQIIIEPLSVRVRFHICNTCC